MQSGRYSGGEFGWFSPFAVLCGVGLCVGYALLGACWLVHKCEGDVRETAYRLIRPLAIALLAFLVVVFVYALAENLPVMQRWLERPYLFVFPVIGALAALVLAAQLPAAAGLRCRSSWSRSSSPPRSARWRSRSGPT